MARIGHTISVASTAGHWTTTLSQTWTSTFQMGWHAAKHCKTVFPTIRAKFRHYFVAHFVDLYARIFPIPLRDRSRDVRNSGGRKAKHTLDSSFWRTPVNFFSTNGGITRCKIKTLTSVRDVYTRQCGASTLHLAALWSAVEKRLRDMEARMDVTQAQVAKMDDLLQHLHEENAKVEGLIKKLSWVEPVGPQAARFGHRLNETTSTLNMYSTDSASAWK